MGNRAGPKDAYADPQYAGPQWSTEAIYAKLSNDRDKEPDDSGEAGQAGQPNVMPGCPTGQFVDAPADAQATDKDGEPQPPPMTAADWAVAAEEAALVARAAGDMAGGATRGLQSSRAPQVDWVTELKHYLAHVIVTGQSWSSPNRRFIGSGLYLPGPVKDHVGEIVIGIDTSASVSQRMLDIFASEVTGILAEVAPVKVTVVYCDYDVQGSAEFEPGDDVKLELKGGGGTRFQPVYDFVEAAEIAPLVLVYLSDLEGPAPAEPSYPTLWCTPTWIDHPAPFGEVIRVDIES